MIRDWFRWTAECNGTLAVICKQAVARKVLQWWWKSGQKAPVARIYVIDAKREFGATVAACVLVCSFALSSKEQVCDVYTDTDADEVDSQFGFVDGFLVSDRAAYQAGRHLLGSAIRKWRSGIKHDAKSALELRGNAADLVSLDGHRVDVERTYVFPLKKGSDLGAKSFTERSLIVPQISINSDTSEIAQVAPKTWRYLQSKRLVFDARKSVIYRKGGPFAIFGVRPYTFSPWKVAIAALYKRLEFKVVGPDNGKPVVFDDTVYFLSFDSESEARRMLARLQQDEVQSFLNSMIFWDDMRPVKTDILNRLDLA